MWRSQSVHDNCPQDTKRVYWSPLDLDPRPAVKALFMVLNWCMNVEASDRLFSVRNWKLLTPRRSGVDPGWVCPHTRASSCTSSWSTENRLVRSNGAKAAQASATACRSSATVAPGAAATSRCPAPTASRAGPKRSTSWESAARTLALTLALPLKPNITSYLTSTLTHTPTIAGRIPLTVARGPLLRLPLL